jgi:hypothetical protein
MTAPPQLLRISKDVYELGYLLPVPALNPSPQSLLICRIACAQSDYVSLILLM